MQVPGQRRIIRESWRNMEHSQDEKAVEKESLGGDGAWSCRHRGAACQGVRNVLLGGTGTQGYRNCACAPSQRSSSHPPTLRGS